MVSHFFPPAEQADEHDLVMVGGRLTPEWLLDAYRHGIFPWPMWGDWMPMTWFSLDPRAIIELDGLRVSSRLKRTIRSGKFQLSCDTAFDRVILGCSQPRHAKDGTWITPAMRKAYGKLHQLGHAHSIEVWHEGELAGGIYGVAIGGLFAGESMFHTVRDASKVALVGLVSHLNARGYRLFDIQQWTAHTGSMGATEISRDEYLARLAQVVDLDVTFGEELAPVNM